MTTPVDSLRTPGYRPPLRRRRAAPAHQPTGLLPSIASMLEIVIVALFLVAFVVQPFRIPSESMVPTLRVGDFLLVNKQAYAPQGWLDRLVLPPATVQRGNLVVFHDPVDASLHLVKRVIGLPGDKLWLRGGRVYINGKLLHEPYAFYTPSRPDVFRDDFPSLLEADPNIDPIWWADLRRTALDGELTIPSNRFFVMGDNRNDSEDSRYWGFVPRFDFVGKPLVVYFSLHHNPQPEPASPFARLRARWTSAVHSMRVLH